MKYWTTKEAAEIAEISAITIRWHIYQGNIKAKKFGRDWKISTEVLNKLMERKIRGKK